MLVNVGKTATFDWTVRFFVPICSVSRN